MRKNLRSRSDARVPGSFVIPEVEVDSAETVSPGSVPPPRRSGNARADDWSDPSKMRQMSPLWPLLWLAIPFVLLIVYELFKGH